MIALALPGAVRAYLHPAPGAHGLVVVPPLGWEGICAHRPLRGLAERLAAAGRPVLRIDPPGFGDSGDGRSVGAWVAAARAGCERLRALQCTEVVLMGVGSGGLIARDAADAADALVLWAAPHSGRHVVREWRAFGVLGDLGDPTPVPDGALAAGGFLYDAPLVEEVSAWRPEPPEGRVLAIEEGYADLVAEPLHARLDPEVEATLTAWLGPSPATDAAAPADEPLELDGVMETPVRAGEAFGILATPRGQPAPLAAVLFNAGAIPRVGPGRAWVDVARRFARRGVATLRLELDGIGDAGGPDAPLGGNDPLYADHAPVRIAAALDALATPHVLCAGLCSGGYWALHTAAADPRVRSAVCVNLLAIRYEPGMEEARDAREAADLITSGERWRKALRGEVRPATALKVARALPGALAAAARRPRTRHPLRELVGQVQEHDARVVLAWSGEEPVHAELRRDGELEAVSGSPAVAVVELPGTDHTLRGVGATAALHALLDAELERALAR